MTIKINALHKGYSSVSLNLPNFANDCLNIFVWKELEYLNFMANQIGTERNSGSTTGIIVEITTVCFIQIMQGVPHCEICRVLPTKNGAS